MRGWVRYSPQGTCRIYPKERSDDMARKKQKNKAQKNAKHMSPRKFRELLQELRDKYQKHEELEEDEELEEQENWFAEDLSEITKDVDFDPGKLWGD